MSNKEPAKPNSRWTTGKERYPSTDGRKSIVAAVQKARAVDGWRHGARVVKR